MKNELLTIANIFGWTADDIQLNELLDYYKNLIKEDSKAIADNHLFLRNYSTASTIMAYFVELLHEASTFLDTETPFIITNSRSQGCPRFQSGEELANSVGKINA